MKSETAKDKHLEFMKLAARIVDNPKYLVAYTGAIFALMYILKIIIQ